jgi:RNA polymerase sigma factor (TIGR02999 family)
VSWRFPFFLFIQAAICRFYLYVQQRRGKRITIFFRRDDFLFEQTYVRSRTFVIRTPWVYNRVERGAGMSAPGSGHVTRLLQSWSGCDKQALGELLPLVYRELRGLAAAYIRRERRDHTLQATVLVHGAYLRMVDQTEVQSPSRAQFFAIAANLMRQILVNHAKQHRAAKRGGGNKVELEEGAAVVQQHGVDLIALDEALDKLAQLDPRQGRIVELRFFSRLTEEEIAEVLGVSAITVKRDWRIARAVLNREPGPGVVARVEPP